jgi:hypothetical protein
MEMFETGNIIGFSNSYSLKRSPKRAVLAAMVEVQRGANNAITKRRILIGKKPPLGQGPQVTTRQIALKIAQLESGIMQPFCGPVPLRRLTFITRRFDTAARCTHVRRQRVRSESLSKSPQILP